jgi:hypothetical protein
MSGNSKDTGQKRSFSNSVQEYRRYLIRAMRGDISPHDEVGQSRKQKKGHLRHGSIKCVASAVGEGFILVHQYLDRF